MQRSSDRPMKRPIRTTKSEDLGAEYSRRCTPGKRKPVTTTRSSLGEPSRSIPKYRTRTRTHTHCEAAENREEEPPRDKTASTGEGLDKNEPEKRESSGGCPWYRHSTTSTTKIRWPSSSSPQRTDSGFCPRTSRPDSGRATTRGNPTHPGDVYHVCTH